MEHIDTVWSFIEQRYRNIAKKVVGISGSYICDIGKYSNESFLLRGYLSVLKHKNGDELSISVDIKKVDGVFIIDTDVSTDDGVILFEGPAFSQTEFTVSSLTEWLNIYELHLIQHEPAILERIKRLE